MASPLSLFDPESVPVPSPRQMRAELKRRRSRVTVADLTARYLRHCEVQRTHGPSRKRHCARILGQFAAKFGLLAAEQIQPYMLRDWIEEHPGWAASGTRRFVAGVVQACFNWAATDKRIRHHSLNVVEYEESERGPQLPDDLFFRLCQRATKNFEIVLRFLRYTGRRECEAFAANVGDMNLDAGEWSVWVFKGTNGRRADKPQRVPLVPEVVDLLRRHWQDRGAPAADAPALTNTGGRRLNGNTFRKNFTRLKARVGLADVRGGGHALRHRHCTAALVNGAPADVVAHNVGHKDVQTLHRYYSHVGEETEAQRAAARLAMPRQT